MHGNGNTCVRGRIIALIDGLGRLQVKSGHCGCDSPDSSRSRAVVAANPGRAPASTATTGGLRPAHRRTTGAQTRRQAPLAVRGLSQCVMTRGNSLACATQSSTCDSVGILRTRFFSPFTSAIFA